MFGAPQIWQATGQARKPKLDCARKGRDRALRGSRPRSAGGRKGAAVGHREILIPRLNGAGTSQRDVPTHFGVRVNYASNIGPFSDISRWPIRRVVLREDGQCVRRLTRVSFGLEGLRGLLPSCRHIYETNPPIRPSSPLASHLVLGRARPSGR